MTITIPNVSGNPYLFADHQTTPSSPHVQAPDLSGDTTHRGFTYVFSLRDEWRVTERYWLENSYLNVTMGFGHDPPEQEHLLYPWIGKLQPDKGPQKLPNPIPNRNHTTKILTGSCARIACFLSSLGVFFPVWQAT